ncbi:MAG TPA: NADH-quinone oxidoreductase subunit C [Terriglobales bacterium]|nr:NADH-quinone oxidoreductase subunit C [Terriglobales bacterium]
MADETKPTPPSPEGAEKPAAQPTAAAGEKPAAPAAPAGEKPAAHAPPPKPAGPTAEPWESEMVARLKQRFGSGISEAAAYLKQNYLVVDRSIAHDVLRLLRDDEQFDYCVDVTAVHYPERDKQFDVVWILYSFARNERMRVKTRIADAETAPSATALWPTCDWLERECYDMFGIKFEGHPDMRRILLPDDWKGHPLRKDYGIIQQDQEWVQINLGIKSGQ